ncbi:MAG: SDR family NAD(P)-dependent oxidoreductase [Candidatus Aminicenantes bacterium]|nr:SDR family NAD(P)-dependent oxidoreductase [Candidatus Aminicenantes bacterium]NIM79279.1 SDR family NAD(P)-dependent oxidoreductase [Candidatus Aminicenantes bacterium]NIN18565.1 SDR family NAD(P)-dependent oxidoreductase [Candidatus Aminicenantes bacterium]NIN42462.1 SDR family NAD(P)-dependent oxidoreductase [Candidatus Aminicenantes bacterium]NIN85220.1 SDR family NAD(P)-dependent oxidoreductase [Candidatus Aminicenantes bacterium]
MKTKTALVTGASSGIGLVFAQELAKDGYNLTCVARSEDKLKQLVNDLGNNYRYLTADLSDPDQLSKVCRDVEENNYSLLVNNAGYGMYDWFENFPLDKYENMMYLNMNALVRLSYVFLTHARSGDALINVSSALSLLSYPGGAVYCGTKAFVTNFSESLWYEYKDKGIYVMTLMPGLTKTNFHNVALGAKQEHLPERLTYTPEVVVAEALKALKARKKPSLISGPRFRFLAALANKLLSRKKMISLMGKNSPALKE